MVRVHTLTGNLLWETTLAVLSLEAGRTHRAKSMSFQVGGKGVNVSKMLTRLGAPTTALFFPGGATGAECERWVASQGIESRAFPLKAPGRVGLVVRPQGRPDTTFLGSDTPVEAEAALDCARYLDRCPPDEALAVCGSIPGWDTPACEPIRAAIRRWIKRGPVLADTYGPPLEWMAKLPLSWVKLNRVEFDGLFPDGERGKPLPERLSAVLERWPAKAWVVTDGPNPVWFVERGRPPGRLVPPGVDEVSPTGSGDVLHACLLHAVLNCGRSLDEALALALPYAAANAAHPAVADFPMDRLPPIIWKG